MGGVHNLHVNTITIVSYGTNTMSNIKISNAN